MTAHEKKLRKKRLTKAQELEGKIAALEKQVLQLQEGFVASVRQLAAQRKAFEVQERCYRSMLAILSDELHIALGHVAPKSGDGARCANEEVRSGRWIDRLPRA